MRVYFNSSKDAVSFCGAVSFPNPKLKNYIIAQKTTQDGYGDQVLDFFSEIMVNGRKLEYTRKSSLGPDYTRTHKLHPPPSVTRDFFTAPYSQVFSRSVSLKFGRTELELELAAEEEAERDMYGGGGFWF